MRQLNSMEGFNRDITHRVLVREVESIIVDGTSFIIADSRVAFGAGPSPYCVNVQ